MPAPLRLSFPTVCDGIMRGFRSNAKPVFLFATLLLLTVAPVHAQSNGEGTIYSRFGLGTLLDFSSPQSEALGGGAYALRSLNYNPDANPALWSDQVYTRLLGSASLQTTSTEDGRGNTGRLTSGTVQAIQFSFPLYERTLGVGISFQPYSRFNYNAVQTGTVRIGPTRETETEYRVNFSGSGGLQKLRTGLGYRVAEWLRVGASTDILFGTLESRRRTTFERNVQNLRNVVVSDGAQLFGVSGTLGGHVALADVFGADDAFSIGLSVSLPATLSGERFRTLDEDLARDTLATQNGDVTLPWRGRLGVAYQPNERWTFVADGLFAPWSTFSSSFTARSDGSGVTRFPIGGEETLTDRWRLSMGAEVVPGGESELAGYFARTGYRFGASVEHMYVRPVQQTDLREYALTAGLSLPTSLSGTRIDFNGTVGLRGKTSDSLVRDTFYGVSLHINFGERWFQRRKLR